MALSHTSVDKAKITEKQYRLTDGQGLYIIVRTNGSKLWRFDYSLHGKRKTLALGRFPTVTLKKARERAENARKLVEDGLDPVEDKRRQKSAQEEAEANSFGRLCEEWYTVKKTGWSEGHAISVRQRLDNHILPYLVDKPIEDLSPLTLLPVLRRLEGLGHIESAKRVRIILSQVFRFGIATGVAERDHAHDLRDALQTPKPKVMAAITDPVEVGGLLRAINGYKGDIVTRLALQILARVFTRPSELRLAEWSEISWIAKRWNIPAGRMKGRLEHVVPLSDQVLDLLRQLHQITGEGRYLFPSQRSKTRCMSDNTLNAALRRLGYSGDEMVGHGFRSTASTLLHEGGEDHVIIELQLAHRQSGVSAVYNRSLRIKERTALMQRYSDLLDNLIEKKPSKQQQS